MTHLCVEDLVFHDIKVHCKEAGLQSSAESVTLHQADLGIGRLVTQQVFLGRNHILQNLKKRQTHEKGPCVVIIFIFQHSSLDRDKKCVHLLLTESNTAAFLLEVLLFMNAVHLTSNSSKVIIQI